MTIPTLANLLPLLQVAIGPVILISGVGLLLLSMTNRYGRVIDRSRELTSARRHAKGDVARLDQQIAILWRRAQILRRAIFFGTFSVLLCALLIIGIFLTALLGFEANWFVALLFIGCLCSLIASLVDSLRDVNQSLVAVRLEVEQTS